jgi:transposase InsO family protein
MIANQSHRTAAYPHQDHHQAAVAVLFPDHPHTRGKQRANAARMTKKVNDSLSAIVDSGASAHFAPDSAQLRRLIMPGTLRHDSATIVQADGHSVLKAHSSGTIVIKSDNPDHAINGQILLNVVYLVPGLQRMLISVTQLTRDGYSVSFAKNTLSIASHDSRPLLHLQYAKSAATDALYDIPQALFQPGQSVHQANLATNFKEADQLKALHHRLGHTNYGRCKQLFTLLTGRRSSREEWCCSCAMTKVHRVPFPKAARHIATRPLERVSTDVCGPFATRSINHERYFCVFIDHFTNYVHVALMKHKSDFEDVFESFYHAAQAIHQPLILTHLHSDNAMDTTRMRKFCAANGVTQVLTPPYSSASNGRAERCIRTITEAAQAMRHHAALPPSFWSYAVMAAAYTLNHIPRSFTAGARAPAPIELWERFEAKNVQDLLQRLRPFGCECVCLRNKRKKIEIKGERCVFIAGQADAQDYSVWH